MKLNNIRNVDEFFKTVDSCEGDVYLLTSAGDKLNLKSSLCKYIAFSEIFTNPVLDLELKTTKPEDLYKFLMFAMEGERG